MGWRLQTRRVKVALKVLKVWACFFFNADPNGLSLCPAVELKTPPRYSINQRCFESAFTANFAFHHQSSWRLTCVVFSCNVGRSCFFYVRASQRDAKTLVRLSLDAKRCAPQHLLVLTLECYCIHVLMLDNALFLLLRSECL